MRDKVQQMELRTWNHQLVGSRMHSDSRQYCCLLWIQHNAAQGLARPATVCGKPDKQQPTTQVARRLIDIVFNAWHD